MNNTEMNNIGTGERAVRMVVTAGLIGTVLTHSGDLGYLSVLPLLSIYTGITAFIGWDPVAAVIDGMNDFAPEQAGRIATAAG